MRVDLTHLLRRNLLRRHCAIGILPRATYFQRRAPVGRGDTLVRKSGGGHISFHCGYKAKPTTSTLLAGWFPNLRRRRSAYPISPSKRPRHLSSWTSWRQCGNILAPRHAFSASITERRQRPSSSWVPRLFRSRTSSRTYYGRLWPRLRRSGGWCSTARNQTTRRPSRG